MYIVFLGAQSDVCGARLDQQDLVLLKMLMSRNLASGWNVFGAKHKVFRAAVLWSHFQDELGRRDGQRSERTPHPCFSFVLLEHKGLGTLRLRCADHR
jgi:hypothetical protein